MSKSDKELAGLLRRDAQKVEGGASFEAKLHHDTMRRIRQMGALGAPRAWHRYLAAPAVLGVAALALVLLVASLVFWPAPDPDPAGVARAEQAVPTLPQLDEPPASALAYRRAMADGEDALFALLDRDARTLLPRSSSVFQSKR